MAVADARLYNGDGGVFDHRAYKPCAAARNQHVYIFVHGHKLVGTLVRNVGYKLYAVLR